MLFMCQGRPRPGLTQDDQKKALDLFRSWQPPAGLEIRAHYLGATGGDFIVIETDSLGALVEAVAIWAPFVTYEVTPIVAVQEGIECVARAESARTKLIA